MYSIKVEQLSRSEEPLPEGSDAPQPREQGAAGRPGSGHDDDSGVGAAKLAFSCGNPRVEHIVGVLHLYRQVPSREEAELWSHRLRRPSSKRALPAERDKQVCILAIPGDMSFGDFCTWSRSHFEHMRLIQLVRREDTDQALCAVLLTFGTQEAADEFYCESNGEPFTSLEPELICRVVFVREVEFLHCHNAPSAAAPQQQQQQQQPQQQPLDNAGSGAGLASQKSSSSSQSGSTHQGTAAALLPPPGLTELPTCPVCLERLDHHISGVVTTVCNHKFHNECLQQWGDTSCPVCRYSMQPASTSTCDSCGATSDLWICLICGHVGCGRYNRGDARDHFRQTQHCYALEVLSGRVWDYVGDGYVHRLVQSHVDGKLVEVEPPATSSAAQRRLACSDDEEGGGAESELATALRESKIDAVVMEYSHLLVVQLESQRKWWEGQLETQREESEGQSKALQVSLDRAHEQLKEVRQELAGSQKVRQQLQEKLKESQGDALRLGKEVADLQALHEQVVANQSAYVDQLKQAQAQAEERGQTIKDLEEQLRDLMFFIEAQRVAAETGSEIQGGSVLPLQDSPGSSGRAGRRGRGRKSK